MFRFLEPSIQTLLFLILSRKSKKEVGVFRYLSIVSGSIRRDMTHSKMLSLQALATGSYQYHLSRRRLFHWFKLFGWDQAEVILNS